MAIVKELEVTYYDTKDILYLHILPKRRGRMEGFDYDFYIRYDWEDENEVVGFEWLDFSLYYGVADEINILSELDMRFSVEGTDLKKVKIKEVLDWAYNKYVLKKEALKVGS